MGIEPSSKYTNMASSFRSILGASPSKASTDDSVLLIIDAQNEYASGKLAVRDVDASRAKIASLLEKYRAAGAPLVHATPEGAPIFTPGTALAEEFQELTPRSGESVVTKNFPGSFTQTNLHELLQKTGRKKVVVTGYMAHVCVTMTSRQAMEHGYDVVIAGDAVGDRDIPGVKGDELTRTVLAELADAIGTVVQSDEIA